MHLMECRQTRKHTKITVNQETVIGYVDDSGPCRTLKIDREIQFMEHEGPNTWAHPAAPPPPPHGRGPSVASRTGRRSSVETY